MSPVQTNQNSTTETFSSVPVLDYSLIQNGQKEQFLAELRHVLVNVGFLYLANPPINDVGRQLASFRFVSDRSGPNRCAWLYIVILQTIPF